MNRRAGAGKGNPDLPACLTGGITGVPRSLALGFQRDGLSRSLGSQPLFLRLASGLFSSLCGLLGGLTLRFRFPGGSAFGHPDLSSIADRLASSLLLLHSRVIGTWPCMEALEH